MALGSVCLLYVSTSWLSDVNDAKFSLQQVHNHVISTHCLAIGSLTVILS